MVFSLSAERGARRGSGEQLLEIEGDVGGGGAERPRQDHVALVVDD